MGKANRHSPEFHERAVRLPREQRHECKSDWVPRYNDERLHGELDYLSPSGYEEQYRQNRSESAVAD